MERVYTHFDDGIGYRSTIWGSQVKTTQSTWPEEMSSSTEYFCQNQYSLVFLYDFLYCLRYKTYCLEKISLPAAHRTFDTPARGWDGSFVPILCHEHSRPRTRTWLDARLRGQLSWLYTPRVVYSNDRWKNGGKRLLFPRHGTINFTSTFTVVWKWAH